METRSSALDRAATWATFSLRWSRRRHYMFPLEARGKPRCAGTSMADASGSLIAVVDDDRTVLESLEMLLESAHYTARVFDSAAALLESGCLAEIDCLISDIAMPSMGGFELMNAAHQV